MIAALGLRGDERIVDVGAGSGYFTWRLAAAVPRGSVCAVELDAGLRGVLETEARRRSATQVAVAAAASGPVDLIFACNMLRALTPENLARIDPNARLAVIDFAPEALEAGDLPPRALRVPKEQVIARLEPHYLLEVSLALPRQYLLRFRRRP